MAVLGHAQNDFGIQKSQWARTPETSTADRQNACPTSRSRMSSRQSRAILRMDQRQDLRAAGGVLLEDAAQGTRDHNAAVLFGAANGHAGVNRFDHAN